VTMKDMIGRVGSTGWSTGPHLHFTIMRHGRDLNPLYFIW
jgi:murein DD-endopeptidase MepM/ murein hydrolase activator NlpD